jgi:hypothetical protein
MRHLPSLVHKLLPHCMALYRDGAEVGIDRSSFTYGTCRVDFTWRKKAAATAAAEKLGRTNDHDYRQQFIT